MKLYLYYIVNDDLILELRNKHLLDTIDRNTKIGEPFLYACTTNKKLAKKFEETRDMTKLHKITREVYDANDIASDMWRRIHEVSLFVGGNTHLVIPLTGAEKWTVDYLSETILSVMDEHHLVTSAIFTDEIRIFLDVIGYPVQNFIHPDDGIGEYPDTVENDEWNDIVAHEVASGEWENELGAILWLYNGLFNISGCMKVGEIENGRDSTKAYLCSIFEHG